MSLICQLLWLKIGEKKDLLCAHFQPSPFQNMLWNLPLTEESSGAKGFLCKHFTVILYYVYSWEPINRVGPQSTTAVLCFPWWAAAPAWKHIDWNQCANFTTSLSDQQCPRVILRVSLCTAGSITGSKTTEKKCLSTSRCWFAHQVFCLLHFTLLTHIFIHSLFCQSLTGPLLCASDLK